MLVNFKKQCILILLFFSSFVVTINSTLMNNILPYLKNEFSIDYSSIQWIIVVYFVALLIGMLITKEVNKIGEKNTYLFSFILFLIGLILGSISLNFTMLLFSRFIQGLGGGIITPTSMIIIYKFFSKSNRGKLMGIWGMFAMIAPTISPFLSGLIVTYFNWRVLFILNIPLVVLLICFTFIIENHSFEKKNIDIRIMIYISLIVFFLFLFLYSINNHNTTFTIIIAFLILLFYLHIKNTSKKSIVNLSLLRNVSFSYSLVILFFNTLALYSVIIIIPTIYQDILHKSPIFSGLILIPHSLVMGIFMIVGGKLIDAQYGKISIYLGTTLVLIFSLILFIPQVYTRPIYIIIDLIFHAIGLGLMGMPVTTIGLNALKSQQVEDGSSLNNVFRQVFKIVSVYFLTNFYQYLTDINSSLNFVVFIIYFSIATSQFFALFIVFKLPKN